MKNKLFFFLDGERTLQHEAAPVLQAAPFEGYSGTFQSPFKETELTGRLDYSLTKTARLFGRFNYFQNSADATFFSSSFSVYNNKDYTRNEVVGLDFNTGSFTHTIRFSYLKFQNQIVDADDGYEPAIGESRSQYLHRKLQHGPERTGAAEHSAKRPSDQV